MRMEQDWVDKEFYEMVEANHLYEDVLVPVLADNSLVRHTLMCLPFLSERSEEEDCKSELEKLLTSHYNLPVELCEDVFDLCEDNLKFNELCEIWVEPNG